MKINDFISLLKDEFNINELVEINEDCLLIDYFAGSSLNLLFLRGIINDEFEVVLTDNEIKECQKISDLYKKIISKIESKTSR